MRGHLRPAPSGEKGKWQLFLELPREPGEKRKQKCVTFKGTKKAAEAELARRLAEVGRESYIEPSKLTVEQFMRKWLEERIRPRRQGKTVERYEELLRLHIAPAIGSLPLDKLKPLHLEALYNAKRKTHAERTVLHIHRAIHAALEQGVKWELLARNVAHVVEAPKPSRTKMSAYSFEQSRRLIQLAKGRSVYPAVVLGITTGLRLGEILGLKWGAIDWERGAAILDEAVEFTREHGLRMKIPKNGKIQRIELSAAALAFLRAHQAEQELHRAKIGDAYQDHGLVYPDERGNPRNPQAVSRQFARFLQTTGLPKLRFHDLRHTAGSLLIDQGAHPKAVQEQLRHASMATTMDLYGHLLEGRQAEAVARVGDLLMDAIAGT